MKAKLLIIDDHGIYIPQIFCSCYKPQLDTIPTDTLAVCLAGPNHPEYWEAWEEVLELAIITLDDDKEYTIYQDGNLWAIPADYDGDFDDLWD